MDPASAARTATVASPETVTTAATAATVAEQCSDKVCMAVKKGQAL